MSAGSIGSINEGVESLLGTKAVREATASPASESKPNEEISAANSRVDSKSSEEYRESEKAVYASQSGTSTEGFLYLRGLGEKDGQYDILDDTIKEMKENIEAIGEAIEVMAEMVEKTSDSSIALKLLQSTFEAIDEMEEGAGGSTGKMINLKA
tara:strand:+ start:589 stop:1050 length:462 start_codon:yes stop_codon:yes gene_type:complete